MKPGTGADCRGSKNFLGVKDFGIRDQNLRSKCGIRREKIYLVTTLLFTDVSIPDFFRGGGVCTQAYFTLCPRNHNRSDAKPTCFRDRLVILNEDYLELHFQTIRKRDFAEILEIF